VNDVIVADVALLIRVPRRSRPYRDGCRNIQWCGFQLFRDSSHLLVIRR